MNHKLIIAVTAAALTLGAAGIAVSDHDRDDDEREEQGEGRGWWPGGQDVDPVANAVYKTECGGCHLAYPPGLLPAAAWRQVMAALGSHYGDDASLDGGTANEILAYLSANGADGSTGLRSRAFAAAPLPPGQPPRITKTRYFQTQHSEIPDRLVRDNPGVGSFSRCETCHQDGEQGRFNEDQVRIPGVGRWDD